MKTLLLLLALNVNAFAQSITLVKSLPLESNEVGISIDASITVREWDREYIQCVIKIENSGFPNSLALLGGLAKAGRYDLDLVGDTLVMQGLEREIRISGRVWRESLSIEIWVPSGVKVTDQRFLSI